MSFGECGFCMWRGEQKSVDFFSKCGVSFMMSRHFLMMVDRPNVLSPSVEILFLSLTGQIPFELYKKKTFRAPIFFWKKKAISFQYVHTHGVNFISLTLCGFIGWSNLMLCYCAGWFFLSLSLQTPSIISNWVNRWFLTLLSVEKILTQYI